MTIYALKRYTGLKVKEIGEIFGLKYPAVSIIDNKFRNAIENDEELREVINKIDSKLLKRDN